MQRLCDGLGLSFMINIYHIWVIFHLIKRSLSILQGVHDLDLDRQDNALSMDDWDPVKLLSAHL